MNVERLREVVEAVRNARPEQFDMGMWWVNDGCGTAGCAIGHYCHANPTADLFIGGNWPELRGRRHDGFTAVAVHFGIDLEDAFYLFDPGEYPHGSRGTSAAEVVARIEAFIASGGVIDSSDSSEVRP